MRLKLELEISDVAFLNLLNKLKKHHYEANMLLNSIHALSTSNATLEEKELLWTKAKKIINSHKPNTN